MSIHFVSTAILSSSDGINHDKEEEVESSEVIRARKEAERAANKPLYQQLAGNFSVLAHPYIFTDAACVMKLTCMCMCMNTCMRYRKRGEEKS